MLPASISRFQPVGADRGLFAGEAADPGHFGAGFDDRGGGLGLALDRDRAAAVGFGVFEGLGRLPAPPIMPPRAAGDRAGFAAGPFLEGRRRLRERRAASGRAPASASGRFQHLRGPGIAPRFHPWRTGHSPSDAEARHFAHPRTGPPSAPPSRRRRPPPPAGIPPGPPPGRPSRPRPGRRPGRCCWSAWPRVSKDQIAGADQEHREGRRQGAPVRQRAAGSRRRGRRRRPRWRGRSAPPASRVRGRSCRSRRSR